MSRQIIEKCSCGIPLNEDEAIFCKYCGDGPFCFHCFLEHVCVYLSDEATKKNKNLGV